MKRKIIIVFLILLFVVGCGRKKENVIEDNSVSVRELTSDEEKALLKRVDELIYLDYLGKSFKVTDLTNQEVLQFIYSLYGVDNVTFKTLEEHLSDYLDFPLEPENILCNTHFNILDGSDYRYLYNIYNDKYEINTKHVHHADIGFGADVYNKYVSGKVEGEYYYIEVYKLFSDLYGTGGSSYYSTYNNASLKEKALYTGKGDMWSSVDETLLNKYTYRFIKNGDNYILKEYEIN